MYEEGSNERQQETEYKNKKSPISVFVLMIVFLIIVSIACAETTPTGEPAVSTATPEVQEQAPILETEQQPAQPTNTVPSTPVPTTAPESLYLGEVVEKNGYLLSAVSVEDPATPGMLYQPESGKKLVAIEVIIGVVSGGDPISVNPLNASLIDSEGFTYQPELAGVDDQLATTELFPGEKLRGWIAFSVPEEASPSGIKYSIEAFGGETLKAGLESLPEGYQVNMDAISILPTQPQSKLGDAVEQFGYSLTALAVEDPTTPGMFYTPRQSYKLVAIEIVVGNVSGDVLSVNPLNTSLVDMNGYVYQPELAGRDEQLATTDISGWEKVRGWVAFDIPEEATPYIIRYQVEVFSFNYLQTGLEE